MNKYQKKGQYGRLKAKVSDLMPCLLAFDSKHGSGPFQFYNGPKVKDLQDDKQLLRVLEATGILVTELSRDLPPEQVLDH